MSDHQSRRPRGPHAAGQPARRWPPAGGRIPVTVHARRDTEEA